MSPPPLPPHATYTSCWCEENICLLCLHFLKNDDITRVWNIYVVFISNHHRTVALWKQKTAHTPSSPIVWDYHVVLLLTPRITEGKCQSWIYDFDTILPIPCSAQDYVKQVFVKEIDLQYRSFFRKIPGDEFVDNFASDRSHMIREGTDNYLSPPPEYPPMTGALAAEKGVKMNLMSSFVCMENNVETFGEVLDVGEMEKVAVTS